MVVHNKLHLRRSVILCRGFQAVLLLTVSNGIVKDGLGRNPQFLAQNWATKTEILSDWGRSLKIEVEKRGLV